MTTEEQAAMENLTATDIIVAFVILYGLVIVLPAMLWYMVAR